MRQGWKNGSFWADAIVIVIGCSSVVMAVLNFLGVPWTWVEDRLAAAVLGSVGILVLLVAFDRRSLSKSLERMAETEYLESADEVIGELERVVRLASKEVSILGARARPSRYLDEIERGVTQRNLTYYRTVDRSFIHHGLHEHLARIVHYKEQVWIKWVPEEKFGNITVTESDAVIVLPSPREADMSGLLIKGIRGSYNYAQYVRSVWETGIRVDSDEGLKALCESCSPMNLSRPDAMRSLLSSLVDIAEA